MARASTATLLALTVAAAAAPAAAQASWDPPQLLSTTPSGQAPDRSNDPAISADGRYAVFATDSHDVVALPEAPGTYRQGAIVRRDLTTGAVAFVAGGALFDEGVSLDQPAFAHFHGASRPSVSADGRYVAFVTDEALAPADGNGADDIYVRDMDRAPGETDTYILASALDGSTTPATYDAANASVNASTRQAISADGRSVVFWTAGGSDLPNGTHTDGGQVLVRRLDTHRTLLLSTTPTGAPAGSADAIGGMVAVLSADGSTAAWLSPRDGTPALTPVPPIELSNPDNQRFAIWRRVDGGPVQRPLSAVDTDDPACPAGGEPTLIAPTYPIAGPCDGPVVGPGTATTDTVGLSLTADGSRLLELTRGGPRGVLPNAGSADMVWLDLRAGLTRKAAYHEITREGADGARSSAISDVALSRNGRFAAVTTDRTRFDGSLRLAGAPSPTFLPNLTDVYVVDFAQDTITLLSAADDGGKADAPSSTPAVADDGTVVFASDATRLVPDDGNSATDVFAAHVHVSVGQSAGDVLAQGDDPVALIPIRRLRVTAQALASGRVRLTLVTPGVGGLRVRVAAAGDRRVALATGSARGAGATTLTVTPKLADRRRIRAKRGLRVVLRATFRDGAGTLTRKVTVTLKPKPKPKTKATKKSGAAR
ncbi:MAG TPA: hypothetical protein VI318_00255 [Baekduia sp.]